MVVNPEGLAMVKITVRNQEAAEDWYSYEADHVPRYGEIVVIDKADYFVEGVYYNVTEQHGPTRLNFVRLIVRLVWMGEGQTMCPGCDGSGKHDGVHICQECKGKGRV